MGQKINPISLRLQTTNRFFDSCWYSDYFYSELISQDLRIQEYLNSVLKQIQYTTGRFFIQSSQKKIKIFIFFCSPLKSRKFRSNFFKIKYYKTSQKKKNRTKSNQIIKYLSFFNNKKKRSSYIEFRNSIYKSKTTKKIVKYTLQKQEGKLIYLKYLLYLNFLQNYYASTKNQLLSSYNPTDFSHHSLPTKLINEKYTLSKKKELLLHNPSLSEVSKEKLKNQRASYDRWGIEGLVSIYSQSQPLKKKIKKSQTLFMNVLGKSKPTHFVNKMYRFKNLDYNLLSQNFFLQCINNSKKIEPFNDDKMLKFYNKLTYRKHIEAILTQKLLLNTNIYTIKLVDQYKSALFLAEDIVYYLERRIAFRRIKNRILKEVKHLPYIKGIRITCSGRVGGRSKKAQRAKTESFKYGQTSLHIFSSRIDFASKKALTAFGLVGIKVWICYNT